MMGAGHRGDGNRVTSGEVNDLRNLTRGMHGVDKDLQMGIGYDT